ncbi:hypothetical protein BJ742DRAFT_838769 [Cladochytrium replicatum]|nr:hypothetical protein BJ742DRAFT_838769 [Cladochytrium replicatum]
MPPTKLYKRIPTLDVSRTDLDLIDTASPRNAQQCGAPWTALVPVTLNSTRSKSSIASTMQITVEPFDRAREVHDITLRMPSETDPLFHWRCAMNRYAWHTMCTDLGWSHAELEFEAFGDVVVQRVRDCVRTPLRFKMEMAVERGCAELKFVERPATYRDVVILGFKMKPSEWSRVIGDLDHDFKSMRRRHSDLKTLLIHTLDSVSRAHPTLLCTLATEAVDVHRHIAAAQKARMTSWWDGGFGMIGRAESDRDKVMKKKIERRIGSQTTEAFFCKSVRIQVRGSGPLADPSSEAQSELYTLTICGTRAVSRSDGSAEESLPLSYSIVISSPESARVHFTSEDITHSIFDEMTRKFRTPVSFHAVADSDDDSNRDSDDGDGKVVSGIGFLGVIRDALGAAQQDPDRFSIVMQIDGEKLDEEQEGVSISGETRRVANLIFIEKVLYAEQTLFGRAIRFVETDGVIVAQTLRDKLAIVKDEIELARIRMSTLYSIAKLRDPHLYQSLKMQARHILGRNTASEVEKAEAVGVDDDHPDGKYRVEQGAKVADVFLNDIGNSDELPASSSIFVQEQFQKICNREKEKVSRSKRGGEVSRDHANTRTEKRAESETVIVFPGSVDWWITKLDGLKHLADGGAKLASDASEDSFRVGSGRSTPFLVLGTASPSFSEPSHEGTHPKHSLKIKTPKPKRSDERSVKLKAYVRRIRRRTRSPSAPTRSRTPSPMRAPAHAKDLISLLPDEDAIRDRRDTKKTLRKAQQYEDNVVFERACSRFHTAHKYH